MITAADVVDAAARLEGVARRTPVIDAPAFGAGVVLKGEHAQHTGSFKLRGAWNAVAQLPSDARARGVVTASSGNFAQALAYAARQAGIACAVLMPEDAPPEKAAATRGYGAEVVTYDRYHEDRAARAAALTTERDGVFVHPFDDDDVMAGQGTAALELIEDVGPLDVLVVPVGGGGLIAGCATIAAARCPGVRVVGVEPEAGDDVRQSLAAGHIVSIEVPRTIADGQQVTAAGERTFPVIQAHVDEIVTVSDADIVDAMRLLRDECSVVAEPSGACAAAALLLAGCVATEPGSRVGVIISGGNITPERFESLVGR